jgi:serine/threonine-protein kinase TNNI3K
MKRDVASGGQGNISFGIWNNIPIVVKKFYSISDPEGFKREALLHRNLRHPNIVLLLGYCKEPPCILLELMQRGSLANVLHSSKYNTELTLELIMKIALDMSRGMEYLHSRSIIHRDLKSQNVLLDINWTAKISDFGLSKFIRPEKIQDLTLQIGTVPWMAPEVLQKQLYNEKADVYSYGIILWEMITKEKPYSELMWTHEIATSVIHGKRPKIPLDCPPILERLMKNCWQNNPNDRQNFSEITEILENDQLKSIEDLEI